MGAVVQVTANSLTGRWGPTARRVAEYLAKNRAVHILATDAHDARKRPPILSEARAEIFRLLGKDAAQAMVEDNPRAVISGEPIPYC
jgi:protein-tyrosine phosphatase